jgi:hypothetical protein
MSVVSKLELTKLADVVSMQLSLSSRSPSHFKEIDRRQLKLKARNAAAKIKYERTGQDADYATRFRKQNVTLSKMGGNS